MRDALLFTLVFLVMFAMFRVHHRAMVAAGEKHWNCSEPIEVVHRSTLHSLPDSVHYEYVCRGPKPPEKGTP